MNFKEITKEEYDKFFYKCKYNHFLALSAWGQTLKVRKQKAIYVGMFDSQNKLVSCAMVLKRMLPFKLSYLYAPRGYLIDFQNKEHFQKFTKFLKDLCKKEKAISLDVDPGIIYATLDENGQRILENSESKEIYHTFLENGYKHKGFTKLFTLNQPRFSFRIDTTRSMEEIEKSMNKTFLKTVKRSYNYDLEVLDYYDTDTFYKLMKDIANKNNFNGNPKEFYELFDQNFRQNDNVKYIAIKIYPDKLLQKAKDELENLNKELDKGISKHEKDLQNQIQRAQKDIEMFSKYQGYPDGLISLILICPKTNNGMWTLYIGNNDLATYTFSVNRAYYEAIKYAHDNNLKFLDLFGTMGDPKSNVKNYAAIHEYKRKMGGDYIELIGQFTLTNNKFLAFVIPKMMNFYRKVKKFIKSLLKKGSKSK